MARLPLSRGKYGVGVSWDRGPHGIDIDLQAVIVNTRGSIIDAVYYNNLKALRSITHSGDEQTGEKAGLDEVIWVNLASLARLSEEEKQVKLVIFVVAAYSGGSLRDVPNLSMHILEERKENEVSRSALSSSDHAAAPVAMLVRGDRGEWALELVSAPASPQGGRHFVDILEPSLGSLIRANIPGAPARQKVAFAMEKGEVFGLPETGSLGQVFAGLGWDVASGDEVDLDVSAICFSKEHRELGAVFFGNDEDFGLKHSGDNLTGEGDGDDEVISADLAKIPPNVEQIVFVVNIYTNGVTFGQVSNAYCRIFDSSGAELARYLLKEGRSERGLIISRLFREPGDRWGFQALGQFCRGKTWKDAVPEVLALAKKPATAFQVRSESTMSLDSIPTGTAASYPAPSAPPYQMGSGPHAVGGPSWMAGDGHGRPSVSVVPPPPSGSKKDCVVM